MFSRYMKEKVNKKGDIYLLLFGPWPRVCAKDPTQESGEKGLNSEPIDTWSKWTRRKGTTAQEKNAGTDRLLACLSIWEEYS